MNIFASNIKLLRKRRGRTQDDVAFALDMKRSTLSGYENEVAQPGIEALLQLSNYYGVSVDTLLKIDLSGLRESELSQLEKGYDIFITGSKIRVLATTVDSGNNENVELVNQKASAGYRTGFADPEYIKVLPTFHMPFLSKEKKYRTFQINGDSMLPIPDGSWVTGEFVQNWNLIRDGQPYIILTLNDGIMFKVVFNLIRTESRLSLHSLNPLYEPYDVEIKDVREVWKFVHYISSAMPEPNLPKEDLTATVAALKKDMEKLKKQVASSTVLRLPFNDE
ncbi:MAG: LexA family transcriptional regulator [Lentimicrobium sp.]|uniref:XRE family transcriptional regulator n=1 Tax=Lentimicrobium sp. TaxID=2034841 RepID=UPI0025CFB0A9|nr:LexA family transcriptional regulator [Lentimicrobium sp.]MCO5255271.1 LexA family transcriptional regulator [Lentimicrobium sp.]MCO5263308.1 LexA family transcriptional regulator [Lentimicrobium sp.]HRW69098.1 LexA family transcriptional regulator [Lentimicrobium sp.]